MATNKRERPLVIHEPGEEVQEALPPKPYHDPMHPADAPVNRKPSMTYDEAMALREAGKLLKSVLTEQGIVTP